MSSDLTVAQTTTQGQIVQNTLEEKASRIEEKIFAKLRQEVLDAKEKKLEEFKQEMLRAHESSFMNLKGMMFPGVRTKTFDFSGEELSALNNLVAKSAKNRLKWFAAINAAIATSAIIPAVSYSPLFLLILLGLNINWAFLCGNVSGVLSSIRFFLTRDLWLEDQKQKAKIADEQKSNPAGKEE